MVLSGHKYLLLLRWWLIFVAALLPLGWVTYQAWIMNLGADPAEAIVDFTGIWTLRFLLITLAVTPLRKLFHWLWLMRFRRMMGLYTWFYAGIHLLAFITFILGWRLDLLWTELTDRPYIIVGALAFMLLIPLGVTSTKKMQRRLGKRWQQLHQTVYLIAILALVHFIWQIRSNYLEVLVYSLILAALLGYRLYIKVQKLKTAQLSQRLNAH